MAKKPKHVTVKIEHEPEGTTYRVGDLVSVSLGWMNGRSFDAYAKVLNLIEVNTDTDHYVVNTFQEVRSYYGKEKVKVIKEHNTFEVVTGNGSVNSKICFKLKLLCRHTDSRWESVDRILYDMKKYGQESEIVYCNPHNVFMVSLEDVEKNYNETLNIMNEKLKFVRENINREDKINLIIEEHG